MNKSATPPKLLLRFFRWYCHRDYLEDIEGDLLERFENKVEKMDIVGKWNYTVETETTMNIPEI